MLRRLLFLSIIFLLLQTNTIAVSGEIQSARAIEIQAAFLVKFSSYVKWPKESFLNPADPVIIGILGRDPFGSTIDKIARSFHTNNRSVEIRRFNDIGSLHRVHILFIPSAEIGKMNDINSALSNYAVLLTSNAPGFLEQSGMINFIMVNKKIRFNISRTNSQKAGLEISSKLLRVAHKIQ